MDVKKGISVVIITKNEADTVSRALDSVTDIADEIILVDSGSDDATQLLAKQHRSRPKIYEKAWSDDFSALRNHAISLCSFSYCVMLDADEYIKEECRINFRETILSAMKNDDNLLYAPVIDNLNGTVLTNNPRIFKIRKNLNYKGRVHEYLYDEQNSQVIYLSELIINHIGYNEEVYTKRKKRERNLKLLRKQIADDPVNMRWYYFLTRYLDENSAEYIRILFKFGELVLPYEDHLEVYALNLKTALIMHLIATNNFDEALEHVKQLYLIYKDLNTTTLFMVASLVCSLQRFEEEYYLFHEKLNDLKYLNEDDMLHIKVSDEYLENCMQFILARLNKISSNHGQ